MRIICPNCGSDDMRVRSECLDAWSLTRSFVVNKCYPKEPCVPQAPSERMAQDTGGDEAVGEGDSSCKPSNLVSPSEGG